MMTREQARLYVKDNAGTDAVPALTADEVERCLDRSRIVDANGTRVNEPGYVETIWGTRAVVVALDMRVSKASSKTDLKIDGAVLPASQRVEQLRQVRASWRSRMLPGTV